MALAAGQARADDKEALLGPLRARNHHPIFTGLLNPPPEAANLATGLAWEVGVNHSSIFAMGANGAWYIHMDKELTEFDFSLRAPALDGKIEAGLEVPLLVSSAGFLDQLVRNYHRFTGLPGYGWQDHFPDNFYVDKLYRGQALFHLGHQDRLEPGDVTLWLKGRAWRKENLSASWQFFIQAPTGAAEAGLGSGFWEFGGRALATGDYSGLGVYLSLGVYFPDRLKGISGDVGLDPMISAFTGFEWTLWGKWAILAQFTYTSSPMAREGNDFFSLPWMDATLGFKRAMGRGKSFGFALSENLNQTAPDFSIHVSLAM